MENTERQRAVSGLEISIKGARDGREGALEEILKSSLGQEIISHSLARVVEDAADSPRYAAWAALLELHPDPIWLARRFGDHPDATISAEALERKASFDELDAQLKNPAS